MALFGLGTYREKGEKSIERFAKQKAGFEGSQEKLGFKMAKLRKRRDNSGRLENFLLGRNEKLRVYDSLKK